MKIFHPEPVTFLEPVNEPKNYAKSESEILLEQFGITGQLAKDFIAHRKAKRA